MTSDVLFPDIPSQKTMAVLLSAFVAVVLLNVPALTGNVAVNI